MGTFKEYARYYDLFYKNKNYAREAKDVLELIACLDCNTLQEPTFDSWTAYFVCRKI